MKTGRKNNILFLGEWAGLDQYLDNCAEAGFTYACLQQVPEEKRNSLFLNYDFLIVNNFDLTPYVHLLGGLRLVISAATGYNFLHLDTFRKHGVNIANLPCYSTGAVAQYVMWAVLHGVRKFDDATRRGRSGDWSKEGLCGRDLSSLTAGMIGLGDIGQNTAALLMGLGMRVYSASRFPNWGGIVPCIGLEEIARISDVLCITCRHDVETEKIIDSSLLGQAKEDVVLICISPHPVIDLDALSNFLETHPKAKAILDIDSIPESHSLLQRENLIITPHIAFFTYSSLQQRIDMCLKLLNDFERNKYTPLVTDNIPTSQKHVETSNGLTTYYIPNRRTEDHLLYLADAFFATQILYTCLKLGVFDAIERGAKTIRHIGKVSQAHQEPLELVLNACASLGLLHKDGNGNYFNSATASQFLVTHSDRYYGDTLVCATETGYASWGRLLDFLRTGISPMNYEQNRRTCAKVARRSTLGAESQSRGIAPLVLKLMIPNRGRFRILDIGCGAATITREILRNCPDADATLLDTPTVLDFCLQRFLAPQGLHNRCTLLAGDYNCIQDFQDDYDYVLLSNILHIDGAESAQTLLRKGYAALKPGGKLIAISFFLNNREDSPVFSTMFSLSCMLLSGKGKVFSTGRVADWLVEMGYKRICVYHLTPIVKAVTGIKPSNEGK